MKPGLTIALTLAAAVFTGRVLLGQTSRTAEAQFKAAQNTEQVEGDHKSAIEQYKKLAQGSDRAVAARAQARLEALQSPAVAQVGQTTRLLWSDLGKWLGNSDVGPPSADGRYLTFSGEAANLALLDLKSGSTRLLTDNKTGGYVESSAVSPDGRQVAYDWDLSPAQKEEVRVVPVSGGKSRSVYVGDGYLDVLGWSPDGKSVLVERDAMPRNQLAVISIADGAVRVIKDDFAGMASFSPDGRFVAYNGRPNGTDGRDIFVATLDGVETRIVESPGDDRTPLWSPDGSHIVFVSNRTGNTSLWMIPVAGGKVSGPARLVKDNVGSFNPLGFTRSGSLYYIAGSPTSNVYTADLDAKLNAAAAPAMATNRFVNSNRSGSWSPDGQSLAYHASSPRGVGIRIRSVTSGAEREVPALIQVSGPVRWFPDGQSLLVASRDVRLLNGNMGYYRVNVVSGNAELLHQTVYRNVVSTRPDLSTDGKTIFYLETPEQPVRFDIESRRETKLARVGASLPWHQQSLTLAVSPDGLQVAYLGANSLVVGPAAGGETREVVRFSGSSHPAERADGLGLTWSPDQRHLFFVKPDIRAIWRVPIAGGEPENIGISMKRLRALRMHPDGRRIAFDSVVDAPSEVWVLENFLPKPNASK